MSNTTLARYNWIDWCKSIAIFLVIWGHLPVNSSIITPIIYSFHMPLFFLISGYLYKSKDSIKEELIKNIKTLIVPYLIYQLLFYPYWFIKQCLDFHHSFSLYGSVIHPIVQSLLSDPINGPTWFIYCLFLIKMLTYFIQKRQSTNYIFTILCCILSIYICYCLNKHCIFGTYVIHHFFALQIFFFAGIALKHINIEYISKSFHKSLICFLIITALFSALISIGFKGNYTTIAEIIRFYALGFTGSFMVLGIGFMLNQVKSKINYNISIGTMVILGTHWMFIGVINFIIEKYIHHSSNITYSAFAAFTLSIIITILSYPLIIIFQKHLPILLGKISLKK